MAFCSNCGKEIPEGASVCPSCGASLANVAAPEAVNWDHTDEFDAEDISNNKVYALSAYLFSILGVILCHLLAKESPYALFHAREALKLNVVIIVIYLLSCFFCWTCIAPVAGAILILMLAVVKVICFVQVCKGEAKEPWLVRSIGALH
ncbi:MAG: zinc-ribbon domain-containing protein [Lachnospiraceae bacterium]|nr:zinc-ribbon domain-containing protein [Lachnospiraceae bacterium]